jgi:hypothetical protein
LRKARFASEEAALAAVGESGLVLRPYRCDRGDHFHLTSRTKGKPTPRMPAADRTFDRVTAIVTRS